MYHVLFITWFKFLACNLQYRSVNVVCFCSQKGFNTYIKRVNVRRFRLLLYMNTVLDKKNL
jgi:hypothetical protein